jgi:hypothetical protein
MSSAFRAALFSGREWGKPQARFDFGEAADDDPAKNHRAVRMALVFPPSCPAQGRA